MLFAGPATAGSIAPNVKLKPEQGNNVDAGAKFNFPRVSGGAYVFVNQYKDFVVQDLTTAITPAGPLVQGTNYADVRIHGLELSADAPVVTAKGILTLSASGAFTRGTITKGINPPNGSALDEPSGQHHADQGSRHDDSLNQLAAGGPKYGVRTQWRHAHHANPADLAVPDRAGPGSLDGFTVHRSARVCSSPAAGTVSA
jgi:outer membrane receptor protein involved in Fe transport